MSEWSELGDLGLPRTDTKRCGIVNETARNELHIDMG